jgi:DNA-binding beta-propeller fold protein YncE
MIAERKIAAAIATACLLAGLAVADDFSSTTTLVGRNGDTTITPVNQVVTPAGKLTDLPGMRPQALALSPDERILVTAGLTHVLVALDPATGAILQRVSLPTGQVGENGPVAPAILNPDEKAQMSYAGLIFSPNGGRIYMSDIVGVVRVFSVAHDGKITPFGSLALPAVTNATRINDIAAGIAVSPDGKILYVAGNLSNKLFEMDAATGKILRSWPVGVAPLNVVLAGHKVYVSNWGGRQPDSSSLTGPAGLGTKVRTDVRGIASEGSVTVLDVARDAAPAALREIVTGPHAGALAVSPNGRWVVAASAGSDLLSVIDTRDDEVVETVSARQNPGDIFGAQPDALAFDSSGKTLYCANGSQNGVAVFQFRPRETKYLGLIPAGWFPSAVVYEPRGRKLCVANLKQISAKSEKAHFDVQGFGFNTKQYGGSLSLIPVPSKSELAELTGKVLASLRYPLLAQAGLPPRSDREAAPVPERVGEPSVFRHVLYIIKENRSFDQVLGDIKEGNGDPTLCSFGEQVTPNEHKLVHDFALLDNTYCSGILSADGHNWTDSALATDYVEREFAGWVRSYPAGGFKDEGADALAYSPAGFIWTLALAQGRSVHDFGEYTTLSKHWKDPAKKEKIGFPEAWQNFKSGADEIEYRCDADIPSLDPVMEKDFVSWDLEVPDVVRAAMFLKRFKAYEKAGKLPALTLLWLPNDHTSGTKPGAPTPRAQVADNDLAMGQVVEAVSHSTFWKDTCIFVIEDDPQNGWDHVSGYRTTAYVISPYTKRGAVIHTQFNTTSLVRTMELMLGLPPMNQFDATATPMFDCFTNTPDLTAYDAVTNNVPLDEMNPDFREGSSSLERHDAFVSAHLPLSKPDQCKEDVLNRILWHATMGAKPYPEWAVKPADED